MAGEYARAFLGRESFAEALLDYARTLEEPMTFHEWWGMARQLQPFYDDAPARLWPNDGGELQELRNATFIERFGEDWQARLKAFKQQRALMGRDPAVLEPQRYRLP